MSEERIVKKVLYERKGKKSTRYIRVNKLKEIPRSRKKKIK